MKERKLVRSGRKITPDDVEIILQQLEYKKPEAIAQEFGISRVMVSYIQTGQKWKFITRKIAVPFEEGYMEIRLTYDPRSTSKQTLEQAKSILKRAKDLHQKEEKEQ